MARLTIVEQKSELPADRHEEYDRIFATLHAFGGPFGALIHSPGLALKVMEAGAHIRLQSSLTLAEREIAVLAVAREKDATYEWAAHVVIARRAKVREVVIEAIRNRADVVDLHPDEAGILRFVRELLRSNGVSDEVYNDLRSRHDDRWMVELAATVGQYQYIASITSVFEVEAAPDGEPLDR